MKFSNWRVLAPKYYFALFAGGQAISMIGTFAQTTAQSYVVYDLTQNTTLLGLVNGLAFVPLLLLGPFAGAWSVLGLLTGATGIGALIAAAILVPWSIKYVRRPGALVLGLLLLIGLMQIANGLSRQVWLSMAVTIVSAIGVAGTLITISGLLQQMAPPVMRGRIMTLFQMASWGMQLPGALIAGLNGASMGAANAIVVSGLLLLLGGAVIAWRSPAIAAWEPTIPAPKIGPAIP